MLTTPKACNSAASYIQNLIYSQGLTRTDEFLIGIEKTTDALTNLFQGSVYACTSCLGLRSKSLNAARESFKNSGDIIARIYVFCLKFINPKTKFLTEYGGNIPPVDDIISQKFEEQIASINQQAKNKNWWVRNVSARLGYVGLAVFSILSRLRVAVVSCVAAPLSLIAAVFSLITDKTSCPKLNGAIYQGLLAPLLIHDLYTCMAGVVYPGNLFPQGKSNV
jgi:hypothetical protein